MIREAGAEARTPTKDPAFVEYVEAIERVFRVRLGRDHVLSPKDFALARTWHRAGVPVSAVLLGVERAFDKEPTLRSLAYCRAEVEAATANQPLRRIAVAPAPANQGPPRKSDSATLSNETRERLKRLAARLDELRPGPMACFEPPLRRVDELQALLEVAAKPNWDYIRAALRRIDDDVSAALARSVDGAERDLVRDEVGAASADAIHKARAVDEALDARLRERYGLPRIG